MEKTQCHITIINSRSNKNLGIKKWEEKTGMIDNEFMTINVLCVFN